MRTARLVTAFIVSGALCTFFACSDSAKPLGVGDMVVNDTLGQDVYSPPCPLWTAAATARTRTVRR